MNLYITSIVILLSLFPVLAGTAVILIYTCTLTGSWKTLAAHFTVPHAPPGQRFSLASISLRPMMRDRAMANVILSEYGLYLEPISIGIIRRPKHLLIPWMCVGRVTSNVFGQLVLPVNAAGIAFDVYLPAAAYRVLASLHATHAAPAA